MCSLPAAQGLEGVSLKPLMKDPTRGWKKAAFSQFPRAQTGFRHRGEGEFMGYSMRTDRFRYVEWRKGRHGEVVARELYDHQADPTEARNVAGEERLSEEMASLAAQLARGWPAALPD